MAVDAQVAYADVLLVTKAELAGQIETRAASEAAKHIAPRALVRVGTTEEHAEWIEEALADPDIEHEHEHEHEHDHSHDIDIESVWVDVGGQVDLEELEDQLAGLPGSYVRIKGIVRTEAGWFAVHRVGLRVSSEPIVRPADERARIVALGTSLSRDALGACVAAALTSP